MFKEHCKMSRKRKNEVSDCPVCIFLPSYNQLTGESCYKHNLILCYHKRYWNNGDVYLNKSIQI